MTYSMHDLEPGTNAVISSITLDDPSKVHLMTMGVKLETSINVVMNIDGRMLIRTEGSSNSIMLGPEITSQIFVRITE